MKCRQWWVLLIVALLTSSCDKPEEDGYQPTFSEPNSSTSLEYVVGVHPLHNPQKLFEVYGPIVDGNASSIILPMNC